MHATIMDPRADRADPLARHALKKSQDFKASGLIPTKPFSETEPHWNYLLNRLDLYFLISA